MGGVLVLLQDPEVAFSAALSETRVFQPKPVYILCVCFRAPDVELESEAVGMSSSLGKGFINLHFSQQLKRACFRTSLPTVLSSALQPGLVGSQRCTGSQTGSRIFSRNQVVLT